MREISFPFVGDVTTANLEIFHGAHGRYENYSAPRSFVAFNIDGKPNLLAGFVCTPLVRFPMSQVKASSKVKATTVAELGNRNRPLDMIVYKKDGEHFVLMANSARGVMKISTKGIGTNTGITKKTDIAGQTHKTIKDLKNVAQLDRWNDDNAIVMLDNEGVLSLRTVALP